MSDAIMTLRTARGDAALVQTTRELQRDLAQSHVAALSIEQKSAPGEKGDSFTMGQLALDLVTSGTITALVECLKAYLGRDKSMSVSIKRPDGSDIELTSHNIDSADVRSNLEALLLKK